MKEKNFWLLLSVLVVVLSLICVFLVGFGFFYIFPTPRIPASTRDVSSKITSFIIATRTPDAESTASLTLYPDHTSTSAKIEISPTLQDTHTPLPPTFTPISPQSDSSPEEFIRRYYSLINQNQYQTTFNMLSEGYKDRKHCCNPDGSYQIEPYIDWWNTISKVTVLSVDTRKWDTSSAQVVIEIRYDYVSGREVVNTHTFNLIVNPYEGGWLLE